MTLGQGLGAPALVAALLALASCGSGDAQPAAAPPTSDPPASTTTTASLGPDVCDDAPVPAPRDGSGEDNGGDTPSGEPRHALADALSVEGGPPPRVAGRFQYGRLRRDLEEALVELWVDDCTAAPRFLGEAQTDDDGVVSTDTPALDLPAGRYALRAVVVGDGTSASSVLTVVPGGTEVTVFDIDGTLTVGDRELVEELTGVSSAEARPGAAEATALHAGDGRVILYLTGRPVWLAASTRAWLDAQGMAAGVLRMPAHDAGAAPTEEGVGAFKTDELVRYAAAGLGIIDAYGNADTDATAYLAAGLPSERIHMLGDDPPAGLDALGDDFESHNAALRAGGLT